MALGMLIRRWVWMPVFIIGNSMLPTFHTGDIVGVNKLIYRLQPPQRCDVVAIWTGRELLIKRVVGLPGEEMEERDGRFYVNGFPLSEIKMNVEISRSIAPGQIGPNQFVIAGDNRGQSLTAIVNRDRIIGRVQTLAKRN
jgi:signal peptidase I